VILNELGTQEQKQKYIPKLASGEWIGAFSLTEPNSGSDAASLKTKATRQGDYYIINGTKLYTTQGNYADVMIVFARTGGEGANGISAFVVEKNTPGLKVGKIENKMGANISQTCEMIFENVKVPVANLIGEENTGFKKAMNALNAGRINIAAIAVGLAKQAYSYALKYAKERVQFNKPIFEFQAIQFMLADMLTKIEASRLLVLKAAALKDSNLPFAKEASMAKLFATDTAMSVTTDAVQILGGNGYSREFPVERYMREAKVLQIVEGTNQIQRLVIAKNLI
jgi:alkylation response protein AidB-like acyl-CoA dehydrogenase